MIIITLFLRWLWFNTFSVIRVLFFFFFRWDIIFRYDLVKNLAFFQTILNLGIQWLSNVLHVANSIFTPSVFFKYNSYLSLYFFFIYLGSTSYSLHISNSFFLYTTLTLHWFIFVCCSSPYSYSFFARRAQKFHPKSFRVSSLGDWIPEIDSIDVCALLFLFLFSIDVGVCVSFIYVWFVSTVFRIVSNSEKYATSMFRLILLLHIFHFFLVVWPAISSSILILMCVYSIKGTFFLMIIIVRLGCCMYSGYAN